MNEIPVVIIAYRRPAHLRRLLRCLEIDRVPLIYAFSDGPADPTVRSEVSEVREILRSIDWCDIRLFENEENRGLGRSIVSGVTRALQDHEEIVVFEDDLVSAPGTYAFLSNALRHYAGDTQAMSVTGWTHPRVTPANISEIAYFDGRAECWSWGTWRRAWMGPDIDADTILRECLRKGIPLGRYGADLESMARVERRDNTWAARWSLWHLLHGGLCLRPAQTLIDHVEANDRATHRGSEGRWSSPLAARAPDTSAGVEWPAVREHPDVARLWQAACGERGTMLTRLARRTRASIASLLRTHRAGRTQT
jgi:hypothetical protein